MTNVHQPHLPVLLRQVVELCAPVLDDGWFVDGTLGAGGHAEALLEAGGRVVGIDRDPRARQLAAARLARFGDRIRIVAGRHEEIAALLDELGLDTIGGLLLDLGVSSMQLDEADRGFALRYDGPLDMRMGNEGETAADLVNDLPEAELADLIWKWGEERAARRIARTIVAARPVTTTKQLAALVERAVGPVAVRRSNMHVATRTFQALRVAVNSELVDLESGLRDALARLRPGGRALVISYHSLEDRPVKSLFREVCGLVDDTPRHLPIRGERVADFRALTRRPIRPDDTR